MFIFDVETLDTESTAVVLSFACTHVTEETDDYQKMLDNSIFFKLDIKSQFALGRTSSDDTCRWWDRQVESVKKTSLWPDEENDINPLEALQLFKLWLEKQGFGLKSTIYSRGPLDQVCLESLTRTFDFKNPIPYNKWYDIRTAVDYLYESAQQGYVEVDHPTFRDTMVLKHHPTHDCAYDGMMLLYGKK